ncbi:hypothetical protein P7H22_25710 [Paenibacillus larvae]|nr:hypothetical protein [Paenibacillus larvae]MDT2243038.1 hypothetical protein [Paenibacillus larvae]
MKVSWQALKREPSRPSAASVYAQPGVEGTLREYPKFAGKHGSSTRSIKWMTGSLKDIELGRRSTGLEEGDEQAEGFGQEGTPKQGRGV